MAFATRRDGKMEPCETEECEFYNKFVNMNCEESFKAMIECQIRTPLKTNKEPVADVLCNVGLCGKWDNFGKLRLIHDDFTHDMMITLSGDFTDEELAEKYLEKIKDKLNAA
jgi:hypothetical protein